MGFEFEYLRVVFKGLAVDVSGVSERAQFFNACPDFDGLEVGEGELGHVVAGGAVFVDVDAVFGADDSFGEVFWDVLAAHGAAHSLDEFGEVFLVEVFLDVFKVVLDGDCFAC